jgi:hypothetical protein
MKRLLGFSALFLLATACSPYRLVGPPRASVGRLSVDPQVPWSAITLGRLTAWTVDGLPLQRVVFLEELADGEALPGAKGARATVFRSAMTSGDAMELVIDWLSAYPGFQQLEATGLRPRRFGQADGFGFDFSYVDSNGLDGQGLAAGTVLAGHLYLIVYSGTRAHYFPKYREAVERMIDSARIDAVSR